MIEMQFQRMLDHMEWADARIGQALAAADGAVEDAVRLYNHVVAAEFIWQARIRGITDRIPAVFPDWNADTRAAHAREALEGYRLVVGRPEDYGRIVHYRTSTGAALETSVVDILTHVFLHGSYHRGQINAKLRASGFEPSPVDYIYWTRE